MANRLDIAALSLAKKLIVCEVLEQHFDWLGTNEPVDGADMIQSLNELHELVGGKPREFADPNWMYDPGIQADSPREIHT